jgi:hypothetical protein
VTTSQSTSAYLRELAAVQEKQQIAVNLQQAAEEFEQLQAAFDEACREVRLSHNTPCYCKYCYDTTNACGDTAASQSPASPRAAGTGRGRDPRKTYRVGFRDECDIHTAHQWPHLIIGAFDEHEARMDGARSLNCEPSKLKVIEVQP